MSDASDDRLLEALLDSWERSNTILLNLLRALPEGGLAARAMEGSPCIAERERFSSPAADTSSETSALLTNSVIERTAENLLSRCGLERAEKMPRWNRLRAVVRTPPS
jgi:hypothetical protein